MKYKKVIQKIELQIPVGYWIVKFEAVWDFDEETEEPTHIADVDFEVRKVTEKDFSLHNMTTETNSTGCSDDTHDLRIRLFKTKREAMAHKQYTLDRFQNPKPWESFVRED